MDKIINDVPLKCLTFQTGQTKWDGGSMILYDPPSVVDSLLAFNKAELLYNKLFVANIISMFNKTKKKITD